MYRLSRIHREFLLHILIFCLSGVYVAAKSKEFKRNPRETNVINFVRLLVLRLVYGFASMLGLQGPISEVADGALVPPGADDDYGGFLDYDRDYSQLDDY